MRLLIAVAALIAMAPAALAIEGADERFVGIWSFDGTCASDDGMILQSDGSVGLDVGSNGLWYTDGDRILMLLRDNEPGLDELLRVRPEEFRIDEVTDTRLVGQFLESKRNIDAKRCPPVP